MTEDPLAHINFTGSAAKGTLRFKVARATAHLLLKDYRNYL